MRQIRLVPKYLVISVALASLMAGVTATILFPGSAQGPLIRLTEPLGLWGGVDPDTGRPQ